ncbi:alanine racemase [Enterobacter cloacae subsp. cloacae]|nr:alanine racemase [Enterobacter cloacae subsp. cloacae]
MQALKDNLENCSPGGAGSRVWSVVANACSHGMRSYLECAQRRKQFCVTESGRGHSAAGTAERAILLLEVLPRRRSLPLLDKYRLTTSVHSNWQIKAIQDANCMHRWIFISR